MNVARAQEGSGAVGVWMEAGYERWELSCRGSEPKPQERLLNALSAPQPGGEGSASSEMQDRGGARALQRDEGEMVDSQGQELRAHTKPLKQKEGKA